MMLASTARTPAAPVPLPFFHPPEIGRNLVGEADFSSVTRRSRQTSGSLSNAPLHLTYLCDGEEREP